MVADIFCPIFTLKVTVLACLIQKKKIALPPPGHQPGPPGGLTSPPIPPTAKKTMCPYFFWIIPCNQTCIKCLKSC